MLRIFQVVLNLTVIEKENITMTYTVFPQFGVGVDVRSGDFLAMDVHQWHSNTKTLKQM